MIFKFSKSLRISILSIVLLCTTYTTGNSQTIQLVKDIWTGASNFTSIRPSNLTPVGDIIYFTAYSGQLWQTDLTQEGTKPVDLGDGKIISNVDKLFEFREKLYFLWFDNLHVTDGSISGTKEVLDKDGKQISYTDHYYKSDDLLYFHGNWGDELNKKYAFVTGGTQASTFVLAQVESHPSQPDETPSVINGALYFSAYDPINFESEVLWKTDGTPQNTNVVWNDSNNQNVFFKPHDLINLNDTLYFVCKGDTFYEELWKHSVNSSVSQRLKIFKPLYPGYRVANLTSFDNKIFFYASDSIFTRDLWVTDGTPQGTKRIYEVSFGNPPTIRGIYQDRLYFSVVSPKHSLKYFEKGSESAVHLLDLRLNYAGSSRRDFFIEWNNQLYFSAYDRTHGDRLYVSDGTPKGTHLLHEILTFDGENPQSLVPFRGSLAFISESALHGISIWKTDGTARGTEVVYTDSCCTGSSIPSSLYPHKEGLLFVARDQYDGYEFWELTDRHELTKISQLNYSTPIFPNISIVAKDDQSVFYTAPDSIYWASRLWKFDIHKDTIEHVPIHDNVTFNPQSQCFSAHQLFYNIRNENGKSALRVIGPQSSVIRQIPLKGLESDRIWIDYMRPFKEGILFVLSANSSSQELWYSGGTYATTRHLTNLCLSPCGFLNVDIVELNGLAYFIGSNLNGQELWQTDGTSVGTKISVDINPGFNSSEITQLTVYKGRLVFIASNGFDGKALFSSDGTSEGTYRHFGVHEIDPSLKDITFIDGTDDYLFFSAYHPSTGVELWRTNLSLETTSYLGDINQGSNSTTITQSKVYANHFVFVANDAEHGKELFISDGSFVGTKLLADIYSGSASSSPNNFRLANNRLYFTATTKKLGTELYSLFIPENKNLVKESELLIYPNPANLILNLQLDALTLSEAPHHIELYTILGEKVLEYFSYETTPQIDVGLLRNGMYIVKVNDEISGKFVKL